MRSLRDHSGFWLLVCNKYNTLHSARQPFSEQIEEGKMKIKAIDHIGIAVRDIEGAGGAKIAFIHPKETKGCLLRFARGNEKIVSRGCSRE